MRNGLLVMMTVFLLLFATGGVQAQKLQLGLSAGFSKPMQPLEMTQKLSEDGLGLSSGFVIGGKARYALNNSLSLVGLLRYGRVTGEGEYTDEVRPNTGYSEYIHLSSTIPYYSFGAGVEYEFLTEKVVPYLSLCVLGNLFAEPEFERSPDFLSDDPLQSYSHLAHAMGSAPEGLKAGLALGMGFRVPFNPVLDLDFNVIYDWLNIAGNKENTVYNAVKVKEKNLETLNLSLGFVYHL